MSKNRMKERFNVFLSLLLGVSVAQQFLHFTFNSFTSDADRAQKAFDSQTELLTLFTRIESQHLPDQGQGQ
jgi:hypothetical protein